MQQSELIAETFPQETKLQRRYFQQLKKAYIEKRYSEHDDIAQAEV
jgi:hypothetical protein